jgi:hypothetical protein
MPELLETGELVAMEDTGMVFSDDQMSYDEWASVGKHLQKAAGSINWWLGDWLAFGESHYGESYTQAVETTGLTAGHLSVCKWVSQRYQPYERNKFVSWSHHRIVAHLENPDIRDQFLQKAALEKWSAATLTKEVKAYENPGESSDGADEYDLSGKGVGMESPAGSSDGLDESATAAGPSWKIEFLEMFGNDWTAPSPSDYANWWENQQL